MNLTAPEAIAANQQGQLSSNQLAFRSRFIRQQVGGALVFLLLIGGLIILGLVKEGVGRASADWTGILIFLALMCGAILLIISLSSVGAISFYLSMTGEIVQEEGRVLWKGYYAAEIPGRTLTTPYNLPLDLAPGPYRFYFVRRSGRLLSAEALEEGEAQRLEAIMPADSPPTKALPPLAQANLRITSLIILGFIGLFLLVACPLAYISSTAQDIPMLVLVYGTFTFIYVLILGAVWWSTGNFYGISSKYRTDFPAGNQSLYALASVLRFNQADLAANRSGRITPRQNSRLIGKAIFAILGSLVTFVITIVALLAFWNNGLTDSTATPFSLFCSAAILLLMIGGAFMLLAQSMQIGRDISSGRVLSAVGQAHKRIGGSRNANFYVSLSRSPEFQINHPTYQAFLEDQPYRLYYTPHSRKLLSAEPND